MTDIISAEEVEKLLDGTTPGPWLYRPHKHDDWGVVRGGTFNDELGGYPHLAQVRDPEKLDQDTLCQHRMSGKDPWEGNARLTASAPILARSVIALHAELAQAKADARLVVAARKSRAELVEATKACEAECEKWKARAVRAEAEASQLMERTYRLREASIDRVLIKKMINGAMLLHTAAYPVCAKMLEEAADILAVSREKAETEVARLNAVITQMSGQWGEEAVVTEEAKAEIARLREELDKAQRENGQLRANARAQGLAEEIGGVR